MCFSKFCFVVFNFGGVFWWYQVVIIRWLLGFRSLQNIFSSVVLLVICFVFFNDYIKLNFWFELVIFIIFFIFRCICCFRLVFWLYCCLLVVCIGFSVRFSICVLNWVVSKWVLLFILQFVFRMVFVVFILFYFNNFVIRFSCVWVWFLWFVLFCLQKLWCMCLFYILS